MKKSFVISLLLLSVCLCPRTLAAEKSNPTTNEHQDLTQTTLNTNQETNKYQKMRQNWQDVILADRFFDENDPAMVQRQQAKDEKLQKIWDTLSKEDDRRIPWEVPNTNTASAELTTVYRNILEMANGYANSHSKFYHDEKLINDIKDTLEFMYSHYYDGKLEAYGNWWDWEIGIPKAINDTLLLIYDELDEATRLKYLGAIDTFVPDPYKNNRSVKPFKTVDAVGANRVDICIVKLVQNVLRQQDEEIAKVMDSLQAIFPFVTTGDGFYKDGSFIQHGNIPYTGSYGDVLLSGITNIMTIVKGTDLGLTSENINTLDTWVKKSFAPLMYKGNMMDMVRGRAVSREKIQSNQAGSSIIKTLIRMSEFSSPENKVIYQNLAKNWIEGNQFSYDYIGKLTNNWDIYLAKQLLGNESISSENPYGNQLINFANMDRSVYQNENQQFALGLSYSSTRTKRYEWMNKENINGWYTGDGMYYLYNADTNQFNDDFWATVDPYRLPGVTAEITPREEGSGYSPAETTFVGGSVLNNNSGTFGMDFLNFQKTVHGYKSWFILGDKFTLTGTDLESETANEVDSVIDNRKLSDKLTYKLYINESEVPLGSSLNQIFEKVSSVYLEASLPEASIGYSFTEPENLHIMFDARTGNWKTINKGNPNKEIQKNYLTIYKEHKAENETYNCTIYPNISKDAFFNLSDKNVTILTNENGISAVEDNEGRLGINNFSGKESTIRGIKTSQPLSLMKQETKDTLELAVSDPTMLFKDVYQIELDNDSYELGEVPENVTAELNSEKTKWLITIDPAGKQGQSSILTFKKNAINKGYWISKDNYWYYYDETGQMATGWHYINGHWYFLKDSGQMATGWQLINGSWYYLEDSGMMATNWRYINGHWYFLKDNGQMATGWQLINGSWYFLEDSGMMVTNWHYISGSWYFLKDSGQMETGWQLINGSWYYLEDSGMMATNWRYINGLWYFLKDSGQMETGQNIKINGTVYHFASNGALIS